MTIKLAYDENDIQVWNGDAREMIAGLSDRVVVLTGPPYFEDIAAATDILTRIRAATVICQWNEHSRPPVPLPLVAVHIWVHTDGNADRYQPFYHFDENGERKRGDVMYHRAIGVGSEESVGHPHQFPLGLATRLLLKTDPTLPVVDPFCGSGTSLIAARHLQRKAIGIEKDDGYAAMAAKRLRDATH